MAHDPFTAAISRHIWDTKYRYRDGDVVHDRTIEDTWRRVARALAAVEREPSVWEGRFYDALAGFTFLPGGRIQAGAGTHRRVTLFNCFVMGIIEDSMDGIFDGLKEGALTMQQGGGVGYDFSTLRPSGTTARRVGAVASGPVSFMRIWDAMCATLLSTGARRGAMMATLRCDHPDVERFIEAKHAPGELRHFNLSVLVTDAFMQAIREDSDWPLVFPLEGEAAPGEEIVERRWSGAAKAVPCRVFRRVRARALWERLMRATYDYAEPGVIFIDRINRLNNLWYDEHISATNPCVTAETWIHTSEGPRQVAELIGRPFEAIVDGRRYASPTGFFQTGNKRVLRLRTREGHSLRLTADHPLRRVTLRTRAARETAWTRAGDLKPGDEIALHDHREAAPWDGPYGETEGYLMGLLVGDGTFRDGQAELRAWPLKAASGSPVIGVDAVMAEAETMLRRLPHRADFAGWRRGGGGAYRFLRTMELTRVAASLGIAPGNKAITPAVERCSRNFYRGFLRGLFDTDGSVQGSQAKGVSVRLAQSDEQLLEAAQRMLLRLGIASTLYRQRRPPGARWLPDGRGGRKLYACRAHHELVIAGDNLGVYAKWVGFTDSAERERLRALLDGYKRRLNRETFLATVESIEADAIEPVYDAQVPGVNAFDANGFHAHNCGEIPLPPYGACDLGSINLTRFVKEPFTPQASLDWNALRSATETAVRMMDNVIDASQFPLEKQAERARGTRRIGLGLTGLADMLILFGRHYADADARALAAEIMRVICHTAYRASIALAREKGRFPFFEREKYLRGEFIRGLPQDIQDGIRRFGLRNSHLTAIAPTGTISLLANNVSSGLEPVYDFHYSRRVLELDGSYSEYPLVDYAFGLWRRLRGDDRPPQTFVSTQQLAPEAHLAMQAALQPFVDNSISKTINVPEHYSFEGFKDIYARAYELGLKGCTTFRPNPVTGAILRVAEQPESAPLCCSVEREAD